MSPAYHRAPKPHMDQRARWGVKVVDSPMLIMSLNKHDSTRCDDRSYNWKSSLRRGAQTVFNAIQTEHDPFDDSWTRVGMGDDHACGPPHE